MNVYMARQPIFDSKNNVVAYELLYRNNEKNRFDGSISSEKATSTLILNSYYSFGINNLVGDKRAFINFDKNLIMGDIPILLNSEVVVVELLEDIIPDRGFLSKVRELKKNGYIIALDDYEYGYSYEVLEELADIIKVDFILNKKEDIEKIVKNLKDTNKKLLAEKVEDYETYKWALDIGFDYFQGYYFSKPNIMKAESFENSSALVQYRKIINELNKERPNFKIISEVIEKDLDLTYKLLKIVNARFIGNISIKSIQHALAILGIRTFERWITIAMMQKHIKDKPKELINISLVRTRMLEKLAIKFGYDKNECSFLGTLSVLDALTNKSMEILVKELNLSKNICDTLLGSESIYTWAYKYIKYLESGNFSKVSEISKEKNINEKEMYNLYYESIEWADKLYDEMYCK